MARSRFRSPRHDLAASVDVARIVREAGGSLAPDILAPALGYRGTNNGAYLARVASARLFGLIGGRGSKVQLTDRGAAILAGIDPAASDARREAVLAVPLYREVIEWLGDSGELGVEDLAVALENRFGEPQDRAAASADRLLASAVPSGLLTRGLAGNIQFSAPTSKFTSVENSSQFARGQVPSIPTPPLALVDGEAEMGDEDLWLEEPADRISQGRARWRRMGIVAAAAACAAAVAVPVALVAVGGTPSRTAAHGPSVQHGPPVLVKGGPAEQQVLKALSATTDAGNFDVNYNLTETQPADTAPSTTSTIPCPSSVINPGGPAILPGASVDPAVTMPRSSVTPTTVHSSTATTIQTIPGYSTQVSCFSGQSSSPITTVTGSGIIDVDPIAMVVSADVSSATNGTTGGQGSNLQVSFRVNGTEAFEGSPGDDGLAPAPGEGGGSNTVSGYTGLVLSTLGQREGAVAVFGLASPTGYLDLYQQGVTAAGEVGTSTVDGVPVTQYLVSIDPSSLLQTPGLTSEETAAINKALAVLSGEGFTSDKDLVSIDSAGFIREVQATDDFSDGGTVTLDSTFSDFGCAGTVLMPGQTGPSSPPANCTSPDDPSNAPATNATTSTTAQASKTGSDTSSSSTTTTTEGVGSVTTSIATNATTTTAAPTSLPPGVSSPPAATTTTAPGN